MLTALQNIILALRDHFYKIGGDRPLLERICYRLTRRDETPEEIIARCLYE